MCPPSAGLFIACRPSNNPLCPQFVTQVLAFFGAGAAWNTEGMTKALGVNLMDDDVTQDEKVSFK